MGEKVLGNPRIFFPAHCAAGGFMSAAQFERHRLASPFVPEGAALTSA